MPSRLGLQSNAVRNCARLEVVGRTASVRNHALYDSIPLNGAWEMAYQPYACESSEMPGFSGACSKSEVALKSKEKLALHRVPVSP